MVGAVFMNGGAGPWTAVGWWHGGTGGHGVGGGDFDQGAQRHHQHNTFSDSNKSRRTLLEIRIPRVEGKLLKETNRKQGTES